MAIPSSIALLTLLFLAAGCAPPPGTSREVQEHAASTAPDSATPSAAEYVVYAFVLAELGNEVRVSEKTGKAWSCAPGSLVCDSDKISEEFREALRDYVRKGAAPGILPRVPAPARPVRPWRAPESGAVQCWPMPTVSLSRVGFSSDGARAVMSYTEVAGPGPFPGCGYAGGALLLLQRDERGTWRIVSTPRRWMT